MKKFLLVIAFALSTLLGVSQTSTQQAWKGENLTDWGSFYWRVDRSTYPDAGNKYWYYVYFFSNSLLNKDDNGDGQHDKAITYISDVNVTMYEIDKSGAVYNQAPSFSDHIICEYNHNVNVYGHYFWSYSPYNQFTITFTKASAWSESKY